MSKTPTQKAVRITCTKRERRSVVRSEGVLLVGETFKGLNSGWRPQKKYLTLGWPSSSQVPGDVCREAHFREIKNRGRSPLIGPHWPPRFIPAGSTGLSMDPCPKDPPRPFFDWLLTARIPGTHNNSFRFAADRDLCPTLLLPLRVSASIAFAGYVCVVPLGLVLVSVHCPRRSRFFNAAKRQVMRQWALS